MKVVDSSIPDDIEQGEIVLDKIESSGSATGRFIFKNEKIVSYKSASVEWVYELGKCMGLSESKDFASVSITSNKSNKYSKTLIVGNLNC